MIEAVLFDLDGTLLDNDMHSFMRPYLKAITARLAHLAPPARVAPALLTATDQMIAMTGRQETNDVVFWRAFEALVGAPTEPMRRVADEFYMQDFPKLRQYTGRRPAARPLVERVLGLGRKAVIATNPLFPRAAVLQRMEWAGVDGLPFALVTVHENMHTTKPNPEYYAEIASMIGTPPARCLMIGDDRDMDEPAAHTGMRFFWVQAAGPFDETRGDLTHLDGLIAGGLLDR